MVSFRVSGNVVMRVADLKICRSYNGYNRVIVMVRVTVRDRYKKIRNKN